MLLSFIHPNTTQPTNPANIYTQHRQEQQGQHISQHIPHTTNPHPIQLQRGSHNTWLTRSTYFVVVLRRAIVCVVRVCVHWLGWWVGWVYGVVVGYKLRCNHVFVAALFKQYLMWVGCVGHLFCCDVPYCSCLCSVLMFVGWLGRLGVVDGGWLKAAT